MSETGFGSSSRYENSTVLVRCTEDTDANARELRRVVRKSNMLAEIVCAVIYLVIASWLFSSGVGVEE